jgi:hypothetical protein
LLTRTLGYRTLEELEETMTAAEFNLWAAEYQIRPWGEYPADVRVAMSGAAVARSMGAKVDPDDLIPKWDKPDNQKVALELFLLWCEDHNRRQKQA